MQLCFVLVNEISSHLSFVAFLHLLFYILRTSIYSCDFLF